MLKVRDLMTPYVETLNPDDDIDLASMLMRLDRFRHLPVVSDGQLVGIVSDRDIMRAEQSSLSETTIEANRRFNMKVKAQDVMTVQVDTIEPDATVLKAAEILREKGYSCLPVLEEDRLVGIITPTDFLGLVVKLLLE